MNRKYKSFEHTIKRWDRLAEMEQQEERENDKDSNIEQDEDKHEIKSFEDTITRGGMD